MLDKVIIHPKNHAYEYIGVSLRILNPKYFTTQCTSTKTNKELKQLTQFHCRLDGHQTSQFVPPFDF